MLLDKYVENKWNSRNKKYYEDKGYVFTKMKDPILVRIEDLPNGSNVKVKVRCDYCGKEYFVSWDKRIKSNRHINKDCCNNVECTSKKSQESMYLIYGKNVINDDNVREKIKNTNIQRYGSENVFGSDIIKKKIASTNIEKYGYDNPVKNKEIQEKIKNTCMKKYGVPCYLNLDYSGDKIRGENSPVWKGGVSYHRVERSTFEYLEWRKLVFERDGYTCKKCGSKSVKINAHHIFNWKDYPDRRYDIENGITLCEHCHIYFHKIYGKKFNDLSQLEEFLENDEDVC